MNIAKNSQPKEMEDNSDPVFDSLRKRGHRITAQRETILQIFRDQPHGEHLSAEELHARLVERGGSVSLAGFVGLPEVTAPTYGQLLPADRILRWDVTGPEPDVWMIYVEGSDGNAQWRHFVRGDARQAPLPDLSAEDEIADAARNRPLLYGIGVAALALLFGWIASLIFRRD